MVIPEREVPGISAMHCARPINIAAGKVSAFCCCGRESAYQSTRPKTKVVVAMTVIERRVLSMTSFAKKPTITIGKVAMANCSTCLTSASPSFAFSTARQPRVRSCAGVPMVAKSMVAISVRKKAITAISEPKCTATSKARPWSGQAVNCAGMMR